MTWKLTLPCTRGEARALSNENGEIGDLDPPPALMASEVDAARPDTWRLDVYFENKPAAAAIALVRTLAPSAAGTAHVLERLDDEDWVTLSQDGLEPIREGRFFVHTPRHRADVPEHAIALEIDASRAFGTGQHATTACCLAMLDRSKSAGARFSNICDLGTGTGLLAFGALALWPNAHVIASDIDPLAIEIARENAAVNGVPRGRGAGEIEFVTAAGLVHRRLKARAPYDLIVANILTKPLIDLAPAIASAVAPGGTLILAGLLDEQADRVAAAYRRRRFRLTDRITRERWTILNLVKRRPMPPSRRS